MAEGVLEPDFQIIHSFWGIPSGALLLGTLGMVPDCVGLGGFAVRITRFQRYW